MANYEESITEFLKSRRKAMSGDTTEQNTTNFQSGPDLVEENGPKRKLEIQDPSPKKSRHDSGGNSLGCQEHLMCDGLNSKMLLGVSISISDIDEGIKYLSSFGVKDMPRLFSIAKAKKYEIIKKQDDSYCLLSSKPDIGNWIDEEKDTSVKKLFSDTYERITEVSATISGSSGRCNTIPIQELELPFINYPIAKQRDLYTVSDSNYGSQNSPLPSAANADANNAATDFSDMKTTNKQDDGYCLLSSYPNIGDSFDEEKDTSIKRHFSDTYNPVTECTLESYAEVFSTISMSPEKCSTIPTQGLELPFTNFTVITQKDLNAVPNSNDANKNLPSPSATTTNVNNSTTGFSDMKTTNKLDDDYCLLSSNPNFEDCLDEEKDTSVKGHFSDTYESVSESTLESSTKFSPNISESPERSSTIPTQGLELPFTNLTSITQKDLNTVPNSNDANKNSPSPSAATTNVNNKTTGFSDMKTTNKQDDSYCLLSSNPNIEDCLDEEKDTSVKICFSDTYKPVTESTLESSEVSVTISESQERRSTNHTQGLKLPFSNFTATEQEDLNKVSNANNENQNLSSSFTATAGVKNTAIVHSDIEIVELSDTECENQNLTPTFQATAGDDNNSATVCLDIEIVELSDTECENEQSAPPVEATAEDNDSASILSDCEIVVLSDIECETHSPESTIAHEKTLNGRKETEAEVSMFRNFSPAHVSGSHSGSDLNIVEGVSEQKQISNAGLDPADKVDIPETSNGCLDGEPYYTDCLKNPKNRTPTTIQRNRDNSTPSLFLSPDTQRNAWTQSPELMLFGPRKCNRNSLYLYLYVGKLDITSYFSNLILQWNPSWLRTQLQTSCLAPVCNFYPLLKSVYEDKDHYYNTFAPYNLLTVWLEMSGRWESKFIPQFICTCRFIEEGPTVTNITCCYTQSENFTALPKPADIVLCNSLFRHGEIFLHVTRVTKELHTGRINIDLEALSECNLQIGDVVSFYNMCNIRSNFMQINALQLLNPGIIDVVLNPADHTEVIEVVELNSLEELDKQKLKIFDTFTSSRTQIALIDVSDADDSLLLIGRIACALLKYSKSKILMCMRTDNSFNILVQNLEKWDPVLAIHTTNMPLQQKFRKLTVESRISSRTDGISNMLEKCRLFVTTFETFDVQILPELAEVTCIVEEAHMCTENETALPLSLEVRKLLMFGKRMQIPNMHPFLASHYYNVSLFLRLLTAKTEKK